MAVLALVALAGCGAAQRPDPAVERSALAVAELVRWESVFGGAPSCWAELPRMTWREVERPALTSACAAPAALPTLAGCFMYAAGDPVVTYSADAQPRTLRHELTHWLLICSEQDFTGDPKHSAPLWKGIP